MDTFNRFKQQVSVDTNLQARLQAVLDDGSAEAPLAQVVDIAADAGYPFSVTELEERIVELGHSSTELGDSDLEMVAGGARTTHGLSEAPFQIFIDWIFGQSR